ncbi:MAG: heavy metal sensor histidine kinase [Rubrivivax sp.]|nr:heavy metal sensor histidine kinase [Rubrivivax sp.]
MKLVLPAHIRGSLALRIALASVLFGILVAGGTVAVGLWNLSHQLDERAALEMQGRRELLVNILQTIPTVAAVGESRDHHFGHLFIGHDDLHLALQDAGTGKVLAAFSDTATQSVPALSHALSAPDTMHAWIAPGGKRFGGWHGSVKIADGSEVEYYLSVDRHRDTALLAGFTKTTLLALPWLLVLVPVGAGLIARAGLAPVLKFRRLAASIGTKSLDRRIAQADLPSELADMAMEFNGMLSRIDDGYRQLEEFSGDLAHEMRTPVATLLGRTQVALSRSRSAAELREVMEGNVEELERLSALINDMLFIARADHDDSPIQAEAVDLVLEAQRVADYLSLVADEKGVQILVQGRAPTIPGDRLLVERAITNLVSNAIRHAFANSTIGIEIHSIGAETTLAVTNEGEGIEPAHLGRVFDRFFRADQGRSREAGGSGLGLAIVRSIANAHRGSASVRSEPGRTTFTLAFPGEARDSIEPRGPQMTET